MTSSLLVDILKKKLGRSHIILQFQNRCHGDVCKHDALGEPTPNLLQNRQDFYGGDIHIITFFFLT